MPTHVIISILAGQIAYATVVQSEIIKILQFHLPMQSYPYLVALQEDLELLLPLSKLKTSKDEAYKTTLVRIIIPTYYFRSPNIQITQTLPSTVSIYIVTSTRTHLLYVKVL
jgi:hypothetical protein